MLPAIPADIVMAPAARAVDALIGVLARRGFTVIAPTVRDGAIVLDEVAGVADLPIGWSDEQGFVARDRLVTSGAPVRPSLAQRPRAVC
jgi:hypothetical protein